MKQEKIDRINYLARKSKEVGLSDEEKNEQKALREEYIQSVRSNLLSQLDSIKVKEKDGSIHKLKKRQK